MSALLKSKVNLNSHENRRFHPRTVINSPVKYKLLRDVAYSTGIMIDISQNGLQIGLNQALMTSTRINLQMESEKIDEAPIDITAEIVRISKSSNDYGYTYGCTIQGVSDF